ncbi:MAG: glycosyltransferase family 9 protein [Candidatus Eisenbacteria bacterium]|uniref:Glycosyltransferase family 9 protein n=1 Tax=Eiseniibacteriota bacterium TaxID=2212470 RepID=A0A538UD36_UNCEI|nr:MAG: glycosyltransferase family 9 protein [Candidatus Eisenbacteria bacterium]
MGAVRLFIEFMPCLGDFVTQLPILHALHERIQPLEIEVSVDAFGAALLEDYAWVGRRYLRGRDWRSRTRPIPPSYRRPFDLLLYLRSNPAVKLTRLLVRARRKLGAEAYDDARAPQGVVRHRYSILRHILPGEPPEITTRLVLEPKRAREALAAAGLAEGARIACLGPGAGTPRRMWAAARFGELGRSLRERFDGVVVLGSPAEAGLCREVAARALGVSFAGHPLPLTAALLASSALYVGNDSGLSHLAAAQGCPAVSVGLESGGYYTPWQGYSLPGRLDELSAAQVLAFLAERGLAATDASDPARARAGATAQWIRRSEKATLPVEFPGPEVPGSTP